MKKITPFLWFDDNAEEAMNFYLSVFKNGKVLSVNRRGDDETGPVLTVKFELEGQEFMGLNGGPHFKFTEAISMFVRCKDQAEVDYLWETLSQGGEKSRCGWLKDRFGLSWQIIPTVLGDLLDDPDPEKSERVMNAMLHMNKIDVEELKRAYQSSGVS